MEILGYQTNTIKYLLTLLGRYAIVDGDFGVPDQKNQVPILTLLGRYAIVDGGLGIPDQHHQVPTHLTR
jgi:hypothetical protein